MNIIQCTSYGAGVGDFGQTFDRNNCTVRALANALGKTTVNQYIDLEAEMREAGRKDGKGCGSSVWLPVYKKHGGVVRAIYGKTIAATYWANQYQSVPTKSGISIGKLLPKLTGNHIVVVKGHAFAVVNGNLIDNGGIRANTQVGMVIDFPSTTEVKPVEPAKRTNKNHPLGVKYRCPLTGKVGNLAVIAKYLKCHLPEHYSKYCSNLKSVLEIHKEF